MEDTEILADKVMEQQKRVQFMTFQCAGEIYGISLDNVNEIIGLQQYTEIPETEDFIRGLINLRGKIIPIIDVRIRFGKEPLAYNDRTSVIVVQLKDTVIGLIVDGIEGVAEVVEDEIIPPPSVSNLEKQSRKYVYGIGRVNGETKLLINLEKLLFCSDEDGKEYVGQEDAEDDGEDAEE